MNNPVQWRPPFYNDYDDEMVYRPFAVGSRLYAVGFEKLSTLHDLTRKGGDILKAHPTFKFPAGGVWTVMFDEIDPLVMDFKGFRHIVHPGIIGGRVMFNVACIIFDHYTISRTGAYLFSAATDPHHLRQTDLAALYDRALGLNGHPKSRLFRTLFNGWQAYSNSASGGREYVVTTEDYASTTHPR